MITTSNGADLTRIEALAVERYAAANAPATAAVLELLREELLTPSITA